MNEQENQNEVVNEEQMAGETRVNQDMNNVPNEEPMATTYQQNQSNNQGQYDQQQSKKKKPTALIVIAAVLVICVIAALAYYFIWNNPKNIFLNAVNNEYQALSNELSKLSGNDKLSKEDVITTSGTLDFDIQATNELQSPEVTKLLEELSKLNMTVNTGVDRKNKEFAAEIMLNAEKDQLINVNMYGTKKSIYVELKNLLNKFIEVPMEEEYDNLFSDTNASIDDVDYVLNATKDSFLKNIDKKDFKQTKETIKVDGKDVKVTKTSYELNDKTATVLVEKMIKELKEDKKYVEKLASLSRKEETEVKEEMEDALKELKEENSSSSDAVFLSIYTKGMMNEAVAYEVNAKTDYSDNKIRYTKGNTSTLVFTESGTEVLNITVKDEASNKKKITLTSDTIDMTIGVEDNDNIHKYVYTLNEKESDAKMYGTLVLNTKEVAKNKKYQENVELEMFMDISGITKALTLKVNTAATTEVGKNLTIPEITNVTSIENLTEEDMNTILTNLSKNTKLVEFVNTINSLF